MDNFKAIYLILSEFEKQMDVPNFDESRIDAGALGISQERWARYMEMIADLDYIKGITVKRNVLGETVVQMISPRITLKGLEYLQENSIMKRAYNAVKGIADLIP